MPVVGASNEFACRCKFYVSNIEFAIYKFLFFFCGRYAIGRAVQVIVSLQPLFCVLKYLEVTPCNYM